MESEIERCFVEQVERINDLDSASLHFTDFGKDAVKKASCSPDAFIQMALQLTNYRVSSLRSLTNLICAFRSKRNSSWPTSLLRLVSLITQEPKLFELFPTSLAILSRQWWTNQERRKSVQICCVRLAQATKKQTNKWPLVRAGIGTCSFCLFWVKASIWRVRFLSSSRNKNGCCQRVNRLLWPTSWTRAKKVNSGLAEALAP